MVDFGQTPLTLGAGPAYADNARIPAPERFTEMTLTTVVFSIWAVFWVYWLIAAVGAKQSVRTARFRRPGLLVLVGVVLLRVFKTGTLAVNSPILQVVGLILFASGLGLAVWARIYLGKNWGMPMTERAEPELVTSGPYRFVRHPIYSGLLLALLGTALATNLYWLIALALGGAYFIYSATVEERSMTTTFPADYASYKAHTKMLIPFVL
ncbi:MAG TPA: isoprenylcysteine carboxylmethyltransferase family protein [Solirubrobacteraceae bacterium]